LNVNPIGLAFLQSAPSDPGQSASVSPEFRREDLVARSLLKRNLADEGDPMRGFICRKEVVEHIGLIWREFGPGTALRCMRALLLGERTTFLEIAFHR
jgi:hypothetical protein